MQARRRWTWVGCMLLAAAGCGGSAKKLAPCPAGTAVGATLQCVCMPGVSGGQICQENKLLTDCSCGDAGTGSGGATPGTGGAGSKGTAGNSSNAGRSGSVGTDASAAGAASPGGNTGPSGGAGGSGSSTTAASPPADGNQLSLCTMAAGECNKGYACYSPTAPGKGFCSHLCSMDSDCAGLKPSGTAYACPMPAFGGTRVCQIACMNAMDMTTCPTGMTCQASGFGAVPPGGGFPGGGAPGFGGAPGAGFPGGGASGGNTMAYSCKYPTSAGQPPGTGKEWDKCLSTGDCTIGLTCIGAQPAFGGATAAAGNCSKSCTMTSDCSNKPATGSISPTCVANGPSAMSNVCALSCAMATMGCPTAMSCRTAGPASYCQPM